MPSNPKNLPGNQTPPSSRNPPSKHVVTKMEVGRSPGVTSGVGKKVGVLKKESLGAGGGVGSKKVRKKKEVGGAGQVKKEVLKMRPMTR